MKPKWSDVIATLFLAAFCLFILFCVEGLSRFAGKISSKNHPCFRMMSITVDGQKLDPIPVWIDATNVEIEIR